MPKTGQMGRNCNLSSCSEPMIWTMVLVLVIVARRRNTVTLYIQGVFFPCYGCFKTQVVLVKRKYIGCKALIHKCEVQDEIDMKIFLVLYLVHPGCLHC